MKLANTKFGKHPIVILILYAIIITVRSATCPVTWSNIADLYVDKITTITSLVSATNGTLTYQNTFPTPFGSSSIQIMLGVTQFQSYKSTQFSFNTTISHFDATKFNTSLQVLGNSYFILLSFQYFAFDPTVGSALNKGLHNCFLTNNLVIGTGQRSQIFDLQDLGTNNSSIMKVHSAIGGLKFWNNKEDYKTVKVQTYLKQNSNKIIQNITITGKACLQWICLYTFKIKIDTPFIQNYAMVIQSGSIYFNSSGLFDLPNYQTFQIPYGMFFGLKQLTVYTSGSSLDQQLLFPSQNYTDLTTTFKCESAKGKIDYLFIFHRSCSNPLYFYQNTTYLCYDVCPSGKYGDSTYFTCLQCHYTCLSCTSSGSTGCNSCNSSYHRTISGNSCPCNTNYVHIGNSLCQLCSNIMEYCLTCSSQTVCTACISSVLTWDPSSLKCTCPTGFYFVINNGQCVSFPGCSSAQNIGGVVTCNSCNTSLNFLFISVNSTCQCQDYYQIDIINERCVEICGDGVNLNVNSSIYCDDNNTQNGDGCSSNCTVQNTHSCVQESTYNASVCSLKKTFEINYLYSQRIIDENKAILVFLIVPSDIVLSQSDFNYQIQTTIPFKTLSVAYDYENSLLRISVEYTETIQLTNTQVNITFDPFKVSTPSQTISLNTKGVNYPLVYNQNSSLNSLIQICSIVIGGFILILSLILIFLNQKIIAVQLLLPSQIVVFGLASMNNLIQYSGLCGLKYINGYNRVINYSISLNNYKVSNQIMQIQYFAQFFLNFNFMGALIIIVIIGYIPFKLYSVYKQNQKRNFNKNQYRDNDLSIGQISAQLKFANKICNFYIDKVLFSALIFNVNQIIFCFSIQLAFANRSGIFLYNPLWSVGGSFIFLFIATAFIVYLYQECGKGKPTILFFPKPLMYPFHLTMILFFEICVLSSLIVFQFSLYLMCFISLIPLLYRIINCPYQRFSIQYFGSLYSLALPFITFAIMSATHFIKSDSISSFSCFAILALLILGIINSLVRYFSIVLKSCNKANNYQRRKLGNKSQEDPNQQIQQWQTDMKEKIQQSVKGLHANKKQLLNNVQNLNTQQEKVETPIQKLDNFNQLVNNPLQGQASFMKQAQGLQQDDDQLTKLKKSLRADLKKRRGVVNNANSNWGKSGKSLKQS